MPFGASDPNILVPTTPARTPCEVPGFGNRGIHAARSGSRSGQGIRLPIVGVQLAPCGLSFSSSRFSPAVTRSRQNCMRVLAIGLGLLMATSTLSFVAMQTGPGVASDSSGSCEGCRTNLVGLSSAAGRHATGGEGQTIPSSMTAPGMTPDSLPPPTAWPPGEGYKAGVWYSGENSNVGTVEFTIFTPNDTASDETFYVLVSIFDSADSYDQFGFAADNTAWYVAWAASFCLRAISLVASKPRVRNLCA